MNIMNKVLLGDIKKIMKELPKNSVQTIITSPPYFGHRKYSKEELDIEKEIGREHDLENYLDNLVDVFMGLYDVLRDDGILWINIGDTYRQNRLQSVPWKLAIKLQEKGWILRSDIIWHKPNAMPSSVKNRPTIDHEYIFMLTKKEKYYYDADAIREPHVTFSEKSKMKGGRNHFGKRNGTPEAGKNKGDSNLHDGRWDQAFNPLGRNKRTVWNIPVSRFKGAHFAVFPEKLVETCLLAATKEGDVVFDPFTGSGTTGVVALKNNRKFIGVELVKEYQIISQERLDEISKQINLSAFRQKTPTSRNV